MRSLTKYAALAVILFIPRLAVASAIYVQSPYGGFGCNTAEDLLEILDGMKSNPNAPMGKFIGPKLHSGECFDITQGQIALVNPSDQTNSNPNIGKFNTQSGGTFYSFVGGWRIDEDVPNYVQ
jgi:hypothetical protein